MVTRSNYETFNFIVDFARFAFLKLASFAASNTHYPLSIILTI